MLKYEFLLIYRVLKEAEVTLGEKVKRGKRLVDYVHRNITVKHNYYTWKLLHSKYYVVTLNVVYHCLSYRVTLALKVQSDHPVQRFAEDFLLMIVCAT